MNETLESLRERVEALLRGNEALRLYASQKESFAYEQQARAEAAEKWKERHKPAVRAAYAILDTARPLILNRERMQDFGGEE